MDLKKILQTWKPELLPYASDREALVRALEEILSEPLAPGAIEERSFQLQAGKFSLERFSPGERVVVQRLVHATADFSLVEEVFFHPQAVDRAVSNLRRGLHILTDVEMVRVGINRQKLSRFGGRVICRIADEEVRILSARTSRTRAEIALEKGFDESVGLVVIGNAPTALVKAIEILKKSPLKDQVVVVGVPVGLVKSLEAKLLLSFQDFPFITNLSPRGGSAMAAACPRDTYPYPKEGA